MAKIKVQEVLRPLLENLEGVFEYFSLFIYLENFEDKLKKKKTFSSRLGAVRLVYGIDFTQPIFVPHGLARA